MPRGLIGLAARAAALHVWRESPGLPRPGSGPDSVPVTRIGAGRSEADATLTADTIAGETPPPGPGPARAGLVRVGPRAQGPALLRHGPSIRMDPSGRASLR